MSGGAVDQRHIFEVEHQCAQCRIHPFQDGQHTRGRSKEEGAADAIDDNVAVSGLGGVIALSIDLIRDVFQGGASAIWSFTEKFARLFAVVPNIGGEFPLAAHPLPHDKIFP